jgi:hypothetical protein
MKTEAEIRRAIQEIKQDARLKGPPATVDINAPLALIQLDLESQIKALQWVLE